MLLKTAGVPRLRASLERFVWSKVVLIKGDEGTGKTTEIVHYIHDRRIAEPKTIILYHFVSSDIRSFENEDVARKFMAQLVDHGLIHDEIPSSLNGLIETFFLWLDRIQQDVILVIDGLNNLDNPWTVNDHNPRIRWVLSSTDGLELCETVPTKPYTIEEKHEMTRGMPLIAASQIITSPKTSNPKFMQTLLNNIRGLRNICHLGYFLDSDNVFALVARTINCCEEYSAAKQVLVDICLSHRGLSESEILSIENISSGQWDVIRKLIDPIIVYDRAKYRCQWSDRVLAALGVSEHTELQSYNRIAAFFGKINTVTQRVAEELPHALHEAHLLDELRACILGVEMFAQLYENKDWNLELGLYWKSIGDSGEQICEGYRHSVAKFETTSSRAAAGPIMHRLGEFAMHMGFTPLSLQFYDEALEIKTLEYGEQSFEVSITYNELGRAYFRLGRLEDCLLVWTKSLEIRRSLSPREGTQDLAISLNNLGLIHDRLGNLDDAEKAYTEALELYRRLTWAYHPNIAITLHNLGLLYGSRGDSAGAIAKYMESLAIRERTCGPDHIELAPTLNSLGLCYCKCGQREKAIELYMRAIKIREAVNGPDHIDVGLYCCNLGVCFGKRGMLDKAHEYMLRAYKIRRRFFGSSNHPSVVVVATWFEFYEWDLPSDM